MTPTRRNVLLGLGAVALGGAGFGYYEFRPQLLRRDASGALVRDLRNGAADPALPELVVASSEADPAALTEKALAALGGLARFVRKGEVVLVKPNIGWNKTPLQAANTNPEVVAAIVRAALKAGAKRVIVADASCEAAEKSYEASAIAAKASDAGAEVILPKADTWKDLTLHGRRIETWPIFAPVLAADRVINVPVAKHHGLSKYTGALKNWFGILGGDRHQLHGNLDAAIVDANRFLRPTLTLVDATKVLVRNGPKGGNLADVVQKNTIVASVDCVAADAFAVTLLDKRPEDIGHLRDAAAEGLGRIDFEKLRTARV